MFSFLFVNFVCRSSAYFAFPLHTVAVPLRHKANLLLLAELLCHSIALIIPARQSLLCLAFANHLSADLFLRAPMLFRCRTFHISALASHIVAIPSQVTACICFPVAFLPIRRFPVAFSSVAFPWLCSSLPFQGFSFRCHCVARPCFAAALYRIAILRLTKPQHSVAMQILCGGSQLLAIPLLCPAQPSISFAFLAIPQQITAIRSLRSASSLIAWPSPRCPCFPSAGSC